MAASPSELYLQGFVVIDSRPAYLNALACLENILSSRTHALIVRGCVGVLLSLYLFLFDQACFHFCFRRIGSLLAVDDADVLLLESIFSHRF